MTAANPSPTTAVLHGGIAVAALKVRARGRRRRPGRVLHGGIAVAALKGPGARRRPRALQPGSPRRNRRGRIEGYFLLLVLAVVLHRSPRRNRRGRIEGDSRAPAGRAGGPFSTAESPWPH